jgi:hypothetical protein
MDIFQLFPMLGSRSVAVDNRNPSATKKGPGRKPMAGHKKANVKGPKRFTRRAVKLASSQTDNVANTPLKSATRGG